MADFKAEMHQIVCRQGLCPRPCVYSVHFVSCMFCLIGPWRHYYKFIPRPMVIVTKNCSYNCFCTKNWQNNSCLFLADRTIGRAFGVMCRLLSVCL